VRVLHEAARSFPTCLVRYLVGAENYDISTFGL
jgi:hypothetical protein